mgnify:CR=1 FL=1
MDMNIEHIRARLLAEPEQIRDFSSLTPDWAPLQPFSRPPVLAAVLIALVAREEGLSVLYTERSPDLRAHSGQVAFPGGKIDPHDDSAAAAALREAEEEVALDPGDAQVVGYLPHYFTGSNYLITPVVAFVAPRAPFVPNPHEVAEVFEVPLGIVANTGSYGRYRIRRGTEEHVTWQIEHGGHNIWGITANLTRRFHDMALAGAGEA